MTSRRAFLGAALLVAPAALGQSQGGVARAFLKLEAQTETGVNYRDYNVLVGDANLELKLYEASPDGAKHPEAVKLFQLALLEYVTAGSLWSTMFTGGRFATSRIAASSKLGQSITEQFPEANKPVEAGGALIGADYQVQFLLPFYWARAKPPARDAIAKM